MSADTAKKEAIRVGERLSQYEAELALERRRTVEMEGHIASLEMSAKAQQVCVAGCRPSVTIRRLSEQCRPDFLKGHHCWRETS